MNGEIIGINLRTGFYAVRTSEGDITVFELIDSCVPEKGDLVSGALDSLGSETFVNISQQHSFDVFVQDAHCSEARAADLLSR